MLYLSILSKMLRLYLFETFLLIVASFILFFVFLDSGELKLLKDNLWPTFQSDYYFTLVIDSKISQSDMEQFVSETPGIGSISIIESDLVQKKLRQKLLKKGIYLNSEAIIRNKTYAKVFLERKQDISTMPIVKRRFLKKLSAYNFENSSIKTLRKGLANNKTIVFLRSWGDVILKTISSLIWLLIVCFYSVRTRVFLLLCQRYKYTKSLRSKVFVSQVSLCLLAVIIFKVLLGNSIEVSSLVAAFFLLLGISGLYYLWASRSRLSW